MSQVRVRGVQAIVVEELKRSRDLREEDEDLAKAEGFPVESEAWRLSFFAKALKRESSIGTATSEDLIGYAIVKKDRQDVRWRVYESVIRRSFHTHNFIRGEQEWRCSVGGQIFRLPGYLYAEQNGITNVCAHAALRTATARFTPGGLSYRQMNDIVGIDHRKKKASDGLESHEIVRILERSGARCFVGNFSLTKKPRIPFQKYIYNSIESGYPAIIFFGTSSSQHDYHVVSVFGHTFNQDTWVPTAERSYFGASTKPIPSDSWLSMFIVNDDNWGSNLCIPRHYLQTKLHPGKPSKSSNYKIPPADVESVAFIIGTVPKDVLLSPVGAEAIGADYLFTILPQLPNTKSNAWSRRLLPSSQLVLRPLLITGTDYAKHLDKVSDWQYHRVDKYLIRQIHDAFGSNRLWMIELSIPELFSANKRKVGEVLLRADARVRSRRDFNAFLLARLPGYFALYGYGPSSKPTYDFVPSGAEGHVELFGCEDGDAP